MSAVVTGWGATDELPANAPAWVNAELAQATDPDDAAVRIFDRTLADHNGDTLAAVDAVNAWLPAAS